RRAGRGRGTLLETVRTALAYATKEQAVVLFAFVAVEAWAHLGRPALDGKVLRRMAGAAGPQLCVAVAYVGARAVFLPLRPPHDATLGLASHATEVLETMGRFAVLAF